MSEQQDTGGTCFRCGGSFVRLDGPDEPRRCGKCCTTEREQEGTRIGLIRNGADAIGRILNLRSIGSSAEVQRRVAQEALDVLAALAKIPTTLSDGDVVPEPAKAVGAALVAHLGGGAPPTDEALAGWAAALLEAVRSEREEGEEDALALPGERWRKVIDIASACDRLCSVAPSPEPGDGGDLWAWQWIPHAENLGVLHRWRGLRGEDATIVFRAWALKLADQPRLALADPAATMRHVGRIVDALSRIRRVDFYEALLRTIGARRDYTDSVWPSFRQDPVAFCRNRNPISQGVALFALALEKLRLADETGRALGCPGEGRCHLTDKRCESCGDVSKVCDKPACDIHRERTDEEILAAVLKELEPRPRSRPRALREHLVAEMVTALGVHADLDPEHVDKVIGDALAAGKLRPATGGRWPAADGGLEVPLPLQKPGEHSPNCPVQAEYWDERAVCEPDLCAFEPGPDFDRDLLSWLWSEERCSTDFLARKGRVPEHVIERALERLGARRSDPFGWVAPVDEEPADEEEARS